MCNRSPCYNNFKSQMQKLAMERQRPNGLFWTLLPWITIILGCEFGSDDAEWNLNSLFKPPKKGINFLLVVMKAFGEKALDCTPTKQTTIARPFTSIDKLDSYFLRNEAGSWTAPTQARQQHKKSTREASEWNLEAQNCEADMLTTRSPRCTKITQIF